MVEEKDRNMERGIKKFMSQGINKKNNIIFQ